MEQVPCKGCRQEDATHWHLPAQGCATLTCALEKGVELCCDCDGLSCRLLAPVAEGASTYPHNMKVYNVCRKRNGGIGR